MASVAVTSKEFGRRFRKALSVSFLLDQACSQLVQDFIKSYAATIGCNEKCILFPLLTCCAACIGPDSIIELSPEWQEEIIAWTLVITPSTLRRIDIANHFRNNLLHVQEELTSTKMEDDSGVNCEKILVDLITLEELKETMKANGGQAVGLYNSTRVLHDKLKDDGQMEIMQRLHDGASWFTSTKTTKRLLEKTHVNFCILSRPAMVHSSLTTVPNFQEIYQDCFLTVCAEEHHSKFSDISVASQSENLRRIFKEIINLHTSNKFVYKLSEEASAKFSQIHDEISDKAKQFARKNVDKVFRPALSYLARLSCILHVLENVIESINWNTPPEVSTWQTEITADTVWHARQVLAYVIEQKYVLAQPTMVECSPASATKRVESVVTIPDVSPGSNRLMNARANLFNTQRSHISPNRSNCYSPRGINTMQQMSPRYSPYSPRSRNITNNFVRSRSLVSAPTPTPPGQLLLGSAQSSMPNIPAMPTIVPNSETSTNEPRISEIRSAGLSVPVDTAVSASEPLSNGVGLSTGLSFSILPDGGTESPTIRNGLNNTTSAQTVAVMTDDDFFRTFKTQIRRILTHGMKDVTLTQCIESKFAPKYSGAHSNEQDIAMARIFLKRLDTLGFGSCDGANGLSSSRVVFRKRRYSALGDKQVTFLSDLRVSERDYDKCFGSMPNQVADESARNVVCLE